MTPKIQALKNDSVPWLNYIKKERVMMIHSISDLGVSVGLDSTFSQSFSYTVQRCAPAIRIYTLHSCLGKRRFRQV